MGLDTSADLFYGITDGEEDYEMGDLEEHEWLEKHELDPPEGIDLDFGGSMACCIPYLASGPTRQSADGDTNTVTKLDPFPPVQPSEEHIRWLYKAAEQLGWPPPDWHLAVLLARG